MVKKKRLTLLGDILGVLGAGILFIVPFAFMLVNALKERREANLLSISWPGEAHWENFAEVFKANDYQILTAFKNSALIVAGSVIILILAGSMGGYVLQRRKDRIMGVINSLIMAGLMVPAAILPTIWVLQRIHLYKTLWGMILVEVALQIPFTIQFFRFGIYAG